MVFLEILLLTTIYAITTNVKKWIVVKNVIRDVCQLKYIFYKQRK